MATDFPGAVDTSKLTNPSASNNTNNPSHSGLHANANDAIKAVETKLGTGSSTPVSNTLLVGTGSGASTWQALTSAQLAAILSDETGSGAIVFGNTPTLITPKVDTINENTLNNGVTVDGLNIKDGKLNTNDSVVTTNITAGAVTPSKMTLDYVEATLAANFNSAASNTWQDSGLNVTLATAGTWLVFGEFRTLSPSTASQFCATRYFNTTAAAAITNSERLGSFAPASASNRATVACIMKVTTATNNNVIRVDLQPGGAYVCSLESDNNGRTHMGAVRLG